MGPHGQWPFWRQPVSEFYLEPDESSPQFHILFFHCKIITEIFCDLFWHSSFHGFKLPSQAPPNWRSCWMSIAAIQHTPSYAWFIFSSRFPISRCTDGLVASVRFLTPKRGYRLWGPPSLISNWVLDVLFLGIKCLGRETDHLPPSSEIKMVEL
jgi:hypothetical protein